MHKLNLIPRDIRIKYTRKKFLIMLLMAGYIFFMFLGYSFFYLNQQITRLDKEIRDMNNKLALFYADMENQGGKWNLIDLKERKKAFEQLNAHRVQWSSLIEDVMGKRALGVFIDSLSADEEGILIVRGWALKNLYISRMIDELDKMEGVLNVELSFIKASSIPQNGRVYLFELKAQLEKD